MATERRLGRSESVNLGNWQGKYMGYKILKKWLTINVNLKFDVWNLQSDKYMGYKM
jgi:hypothetical protein